MSRTEFTRAQALAAQRALRGALGLAEERFPLPAFIGMHHPKRAQGKASKAFFSEEKKQKTFATPHLRRPGAS